MIRVLTILTLVLPLSQSINLNSIFKDLVTSNKEERWSLPEKKDNSISSEEILREKASNSNGVEELTKKGSLPDEKKYGASTNEAASNLSSLFDVDLTRGQEPRTPENELLENKIGAGESDSSSSKAYIWCEKYKESKCANQRNAQLLRTRIVGGTLAKPKTHTYMALIGYGSENSKKWLCGGSLISQNFVLSAAHCAKPVGWGEARWARLGDLDYKTGSDDAQPQDMEIIRRIVHPGYREPSAYNDIALFKLVSDVTFNSWTHPICIYHKDELQGGQLVTVSGWGTTSFAGKSSSSLMSVDIGIYNNSECHKLMDNIGGSKLPNGVNSGEMLCAGVKEGGKDACSGDSGGPLVLGDGPCSAYQVGITSIGRDCGLPNSPGIYTRVSHYVSWIESNVWS